MSQPREDAPLDGPPAPWNSVGVSSDPTAPYFPTDPKDYGYETLVGRAGEFATGKSALLRHLGSNGQPSAYERLFGDRITSVDRGDFSTFDASDSPPPSITERSGRPGLTREERDALMYELSHGPAPLITQAADWYNPPDNFRIVADGNAYRPPPTDPIVKQCGGCHLQNASLRCARCHKVWYCSKECQTEDWKKGGHKKKCDRKVKGKKC